jgi:hypothetical protein
MEKYFFTLILFWVTLNCSTAQEKTAMLGVSVSYEIFQNKTNYFESENSKGAFGGVEYSESKRFWGYRAGMFYSRIEDQTLFNFEYPTYLDYIDLYIYPSPSTLQIIDFPISAQAYLPLGRSRIKCYANFGVMTSLAFFEDKTNFFDSPESDNKSYSLRGIYGGGISYQFAKHFGIDIGVNKKRTFYTFNDNFRKPFNSLSFQTIINYIF